MSFFLNRFISLSTIYDDTTLALDPTNVNMMALPKAHVPPVINMVLLKSIIGLEMSSFLINL
jgi:hypothetical protein